MPIHVKTPDGHIAEFPDGMSDAQITAVMQREYPAPKPSMLQAGLSGVADAAALPGHVLHNLWEDYGARVSPALNSLADNFTPPKDLPDYARKVIGGITGKPFLDIANVASAPFSAVADTALGRPVENLSGGAVPRQWTGNLATAAIPLGAEAGLAANAARTASTMGISRGGYEALASRAAAAPRPPPVRPPLPVRPVALGESVAPPSVARQAANYVARNIGSPDPAAVGAVGRGATTAEMLGRPGMRAVGALARREGATGDTLNAVTQARAIDRPQRILGDIGAAAGIAPESARGSIDAIVESGRKQADPLFAQVRARQEPVMTDALSALSKRPVIQQALKQVATDMLNAGEDPQAAGLEVKGVNPAGLPEMVEVRSPTATTWDKVYQAVSKQVERHPITQKPVPDSLSPGNHNINVAGTALRSALGEAVPEWDQAMKVAGDYKSVEGAYHQGGSLLFSRGAAAKDFGARFAKLSPAEQTGWKAGIANSIFDKAQNGQLKPAALRTPIVREKLEATFGQKGASDLTDALSSEDAMRAFEQRYAPGVGSITSEMSGEMAAQDAMSPAAQAAWAAGEGAIRGGMVGGPKGAVVGGAGAGLRNIVGQIGANIKTAGMPVAVRDEAGRILTSQMTPEELHAYLQSLQVRRPLAVSGPPRSLPPSLLPR